MNLTVISIIVAAAFAFARKAASSCLIVDFNSYDHFIVTILGAYLDLSKTGCSSLRAHHQL